MGLRNIIFGLALGMTSIFLSGCISGLQAASLSPDEVMINFNQSLSKLESFNYDVNLELTGNLPNGLGGVVELASIKLSGTINSNNEQSITTQTTGQITTQVQGLPVVLNGQMVSVEGYTYFKIQDLEIPLLLSLGSKQLDRWYKIKHPEENSKSILGSVEILSEKADGVEVEIDELFEIIEVFPEETIVADRSYHYRVRAKTNAFVSLFNQLGHALPQNIEATVFKQIESYTFDLWLSKRTFYPTRISLRDIFIYESAPIGIDLNVIISSHNSTPPIVIPTTQPINEYDDLLGGFSTIF